MIPKLIVHNSISLDGSTTGFEANLDIHYKLLRSYLPDAIIVGSNTAKTGTQFFCETIPPEEESVSGSLRSTWSQSVLVDCRLREFLKDYCVFRRSDYGKDVIVLVSEKTPEGYINYLKGIMTLSEPEQIA